MTRNGKIARLPDDVRDTLNQRIRHGEVGPELLAWLNGLPEVQSISQSRFSGAPITQQNLSAWRLGGYQDWLAVQQRADLASKLLLKAGELGSPQELGNRVAALLAVELAQVAALLLRQAPNLEERWKRLKAILAQTHTLRYDDHQAARNRLQEQKSDRQRQSAADPDEARTRQLIQALRAHSGLESAASNQPERGQSSTPGASSRGCPQLPRPKSESERVAEQVGRASSLPLPQPMPGSEDLDQPEKTSSNKVKQGETSPAFHSDGLDLPLDPPYVIRKPKIGRNEPCPCGSGKKYKKCCGNG